jgi:hypothetical protein
MLGQDDDDDYYYYYARTRKTFLAVVLKSLSIFKVQGIEEWDAAIAVLKPC